MGLVHDFAGLATARWFLGLAEVCFQSFDTSKNSIDIVHRLVCFQVCFGDSLLHRL